MGSIRTVVQTKNQRDSETDRLVQATLLRNGTVLRVLDLEDPTVNDLERGAVARSTGSREGTTSWTLSPG
ncbi:MAG TPA: hypothetical protein VLM79_18335 [Kofleriaceae bacterium]|nr:hypothetical protein [Kofleriaceae bacterium]